MHSKASSISSHTPGAGRPRGVINRCDAHYILSYLHYSRYLREIFHFPYPRSSAVDLFSFYGDHNKGQLPSVAGKDKIVQYLLYIIYTSPSDFILKRSIEGTVCSCFMICSIFFTTSGCCCATLFCSSTSSARLKSSISDRPF